MLKLFFVVTWLIQPDGSMVQVYDKQVKTEQECHVIAAYANHNYGQEQYDKYRYSCGVVTVEEGRW